MKTISQKKLPIKHFVFLLLLTISLKGFSQQPPIEVPTWAPAYENPNQVQYYYLPDLEVYYDVWNHEFVYLEDGNWLFSATLPAVYGNYDLYGGHVVILDYRVHQPWMHHELYVSHYPRYYHHSVYVGGKGEYSTAFDENSRKSYYGARIDHDHPNAAPPRIEERHDQPTRKTQASHYNERTVGQPVKVQDNMRRPKEGEHRR